MGNHFGENLTALPKVEEFPTSVECFHEIGTYKQFVTTCKKCFLIMIINYMRMCLVKKVV